MGGKRDTRSGVVSCIARMQQDSRVGGPYAFIGLAVPEECGMPNATGSPLLLSLATLNSNVWQGCIWSHGHVESPHGRWGCNARVCASAFGTGGGACGWRGPLLCWAAC